MQPAIELARGGIQPNPYLISTISSMVSMLEMYAGLRGTLPSLVITTANNLPTGYQFESSAYGMLKTM